MKEAASTNFPPARFSLRKFSFGSSPSPLDLRDYGIVLVFIALFVAIALSSDVFLTKTNLLNILDQWSAIAIIACAGTLVIIAGGFDLSVGAIYGITGVIAAKLATSLGIAPGLLFGVLAGVALGLGNGLVTTVGRVNSLIGTLATSIMIRGAALAITGGLLVSVREPGFDDLGNAELLGVKYSIWILALFALVCWFVLTRTVFGRFVYAVGGNAEAARLSGIRVNAVRTATFAISGLGAGIGGVIAASHVATGQADAGLGLELSVIAAIVIGGTSIQGGAGAIWRTLLGVFILALINNGFNLLGISPEYQQIVQGSIILGAVALDAWTRRSAD